MHSLVRLIKIDLENVNRYDFTTILSNLISCSLSYMSLIRATALWFHVKVFRLTVKFTLIFEGFLLFRRLPIRWQLTTKTWDPHLLLKS